MSTDSTLSYGCGFWCKFFWFLFACSILFNIILYYLLTELQKEHAIVKRERSFVTLVVYGCHYVCRGRQVGGEIVVDDWDHGFLQSLWRRLDGVFGREEKMVVHTRSFTPESIASSSALSLEEPTVSLRVPVQHMLHNGFKWHPRIVEYYAHGAVALSGTPPVHDPAFTVNLSTTAHGELHTPQPGDTFVYHYGYQRQIFYCWNDRWMSDKAHMAAHPDEKIAANQIVLYAEEGGVTARWLKSSTAIQYEREARRKRLAVSLSAGSK
ncbi:unnamed protein product [Peniophora sp. CBMAI 1063]|nr:unnamed protein product [Peniophora sp. CBMAI 1063]